MAVLATAGCRGCVEVESDGVTVHLGGPDLSALGEFPVGEGIELGGGFRATFRERRDTTEFSGQPVVVLSAITTLPEGTLYRMQMTRKITVDRPRDEDGVRVTGVSPQAAVYYPEPSRTMKNAPNRIGMPDEFGVVKNGKIEARFEMGTHFIQTLGADESPGESRIDRDHVFVQVLIEREAQDLDVVEQLPNAEEIGFVLRLDVPLSYASVP